MIKNKWKWSTARNKPGWKIVPYTQLTTVVLHAKLAGKKPTIPLNRNSGWEMWVFQKRVSFFSSTLHHSFLFIEGPVPSCLWTLIFSEMSIEEPFPRYRLVHSCSSLVPAPKSCLCFALASPTQGSKFQKKDLGYWETCDLGLPCTKQLAYWLPSVSTHAGALDVPNASGLSQTAPEQNRRQQDGGFFPRTSCKFWS